MADTLTHSTNRVQVWSDNFFKEYVRASQFSKLFGTDENAIFQLIEDLTKQSGDRITVGIINRLKGDGVTGSTTLEGAEESLVNYGHQLTVSLLRNGVTMHKSEKIKNKIDLLEAGKAVLKNWAMEKLRADIISALGSPIITGNKAYASCSEAEKDAWLVANTDRVLVGAAKSNNNGTDHSTSIDDVDSTNDILQPAIVALAKRMAKLADPHIRPMMVDENGEWYVLLCPSVAFRDFKHHATTIGYVEYAMERGKNNPLFNDGDIIYDGVIVKEVPEISTIAGVGASSIAVAPCYLCGAQAVGIAWGQRSKFITKSFDYEAKQGVAVEEIRGVEKLMFNGVQNGVLTVYVSGVADT